VFLIVSYFGITIPFVVSLKLSDIKEEGSSARQKWDVWVKES